MGDWIFTALLWCLLALGLAVLAWALLYDRPRGSTRCPKCWYDMAGIEPDAETHAWTCPECGNVTKKARRLRKIRRRWRWALLAIVPLLGAQTSRMYPDIRDHGWRGAFMHAPDIVVIALLSEAHRFDGLNQDWPYQNPLMQEVMQRSQPPMTWVGMQDLSEQTWLDGGLWLPERWLLRRNARSLLDDGSEPFGRRSPALLLALASGDPLAETPPSHQASVLLARSNLEYWRCRSYVHYGVKVDDRWGEQRVNAMTIAGMIRSDGFRAEETWHGHGPLHRLVWRNESGTLMEWEGAYGDSAPRTPAPNKLDSASTPFYIASSLLPSDLLSFDPFWMNSAKLIDERMLLGHRTYVIEGINWTGDTIMVWIDADSFLIRRLITAYKDHWLVPLTGPEADALLDESWWSFEVGDEPLPHSQEFRALIDELARSIDITNDSDHQRLLAEPFRRSLDQP